MVRNTGLKDKIIRSSRATGVRKPPAPAGFFKEGVIIWAWPVACSCSRDSGIALFHTALNLTLQRFFIAPEAAGGVFAGQLLTHARLDVMTLP